MLTKDDTHLVANAILATLHSEVLDKVPSFFQGQLLAVLPSLAGECAQSAIDALNKAHPGEGSAQT